MKEYIEKKFREWLAKSGYGLYAQGSHDFCDNLCLSEQTTDYKLLRDAFFAGWNQKSIENEPK